MTLTRTSCKFKKVGRWLGGKVQAVQAGELVFGSLGPMRTQSMGHTSLAPELGIGGGGNRRPRGHVSQSV